MAPASGFRLLFFELAGKSEHWLSASAAGVVTAAVAATLN
jgi:hypothetical protein